MTIRLRDLILGYLIGYVIAMLGLYLLVTSSMFRETVSVPLIVVFPEQQQDCTTMGNGICGPTTTTNPNNQGDSQ